LGDFYAYLVEYCRKLSDCLSTRLRQPTHPALCTGLLA